MRAEGYYWVRTKENLFWQVGEFSDVARRWLLTGKTKWYYDKDFLEIDERRIEREDLSIAGMTIVIDDTVSPENIIVKSTYGMGFSCGRKSESRLAARCQKTQAT